MTPATLLRTLEDALGPMVAGEGGTVSVSDTPQDTLDLLTKSPRQWRLHLQWEGHEGDPDTLGSSKIGRVAAIVQSAKGLSIDRGKDVHRGRPGNARPMMDLVDLVGSWVRSIIYFDEEEVYAADIQHHCSKNSAQAWIEETGQWLTVEGVEVRSYQTTFAIRYASTALGTPAEPVTVVYQGDIQLPPATVILPDGLPQVLRLHVEHVKVDATAGAVEVTLPADSVSQFAFSTTGHALTATDSDGAEALPPGVQIQRPAMQLTEAIMGGYPELNVTFPEGSQGAAGYTALSDLGPVLFS